MPELVWLRVLTTGVEWEVPKAQADELIRWYPSEYQIVAKADHPLGAAEQPAQEAAGEEPARTKKAK